VVESLDELDELDGPPDIDTIAEVFGRFGADAARASAYVEQLRDCVAFRFHVDAFACRVAELGHRRRAMAAMARIDAAWRCDIEPAAGDLAAVVEALS
jgi:CRP-like cAMP-binding protein